MKISVSRQVLQQLCPYHELDKDSDIRGAISRLQGNLTELTPREVNKFNSLLRLRGVESPPDQSEDQDEFAEYSHSAINVYPPLYRQAMETSIRLSKQSAFEDSRSHPKVGAVLVKADHILADAYRGELGQGDHAEFTLFERKLAGVDVRGTVLFTSLEPCIARKNHKPCSEWIIEKGVSTVYIGILDPNPQIYARGMSQLRKAGVRIEFFPDDLRDAIRFENKEFIDQFNASPALKGQATFNFKHNDGLFTIGHGDLMFQTRWSNASNRSIHVYSDGTNLFGLGIALDAQSYSDIRDAAVYDMSSRVQTPNKDEFVVFHNKHDHFAALRIVDVKARSHGDPYDSLTIDYRINTDGSPIFRE